MNRFIFDAPFLSEKDLNGLPKIALRKSERTTWKSPPTPLYKGEDLMSPPLCKGGLGRILNSLLLNPSRRITSLFQDKEVRKKGKLYVESIIKDSVHEISNTYRIRSGSFKSISTKKQNLRVSS
jgi:hypothetical protein